jgi:hypothetical protein
MSSLPFCDIDSASRSWGVIYMKERGEERGVEREGRREERWEQRRERGGDEIRSDLTR